MLALRLRRALLLALGAAAALALFGSTADRPPPANAGGCTIPSMLVFGNPPVLFIDGNSCKDLNETFTVYCNAGKIYVDHTVEGGPVDTNNSTFDCGLPKGINIYGLAGDDTLDLSRVSSVTGFAISLPNQLDGGTGGDQLIGSSFFDAALGRAGTDAVFLRDGRADSADCGTEIDAAVADQPSLDALANCENVDALPEPPASSTVLPSSTVLQATGQRAAAIRKCRKKFSKGSKKRRKCIKKAKLLPA